MAFETPLVPGGLHFLFGLSGVKHFLVEQLEAPRISQTLERRKPSVIDSMDPNFRPYTMVSSCGGVWETSTADLRRTSIKFSSTILPYYIRGQTPEGSGELSSNNQVLTVHSRGNCADTYFIYFEDDYNIMLTDDHPILGEHLLPVRV